ncbi:MAG: HAMP domain-containing histidine kinase [Chloroflexi bacterium]|nr:HAMP domain-containing histidine kinase [Chloroflexota bacterium]
MATQDAANQPVTTPGPGAAVARFFWRAVDRPSIHIEEDVIQDFAGQLSAVQGQRAKSSEIASFSNTSDFQREMETAEMAQQLLEARRQVKEVQAELSLAHRRLAQGERLYALGEMAGAIAHDFSNALTPILGFTDLFLANPDLLKDQEKALRRLACCHQSAKNAAALVAKLRAFHKPNESEEAEGLKPLNLQAVAEKAVADTQYFWNDRARARGIGINVSVVASGDSTVLGSATEMNRMLTNLILNAVDAMPRGGTIVLQLRQEATSVVVEVMDSGTGMPEEVRRRCFDAYFTTKGEQGTGLGLAIVRQIVHRHSGRIDVRSVAGEGTTFVITLPRTTSSLLAVEEVSQDCGLSA